MTDNDPLFDKSEPVFAALEKVAKAQGLIDEAIQLVLVRKGQPSPAQPSPAHAPCQARLERITFQDARAMAPTSTPRPTPTPGRAPAPKPT